MRRATGPCKQLNGEGIKGATLGYTSPVIAGQCSIVSAKCVWNVRKKELAKSSNNICKRRDLCDRALSGQLSSNFMVIIGLPKKIKTNLVYFQVFRMQPFFSVRYLNTRKRRETYKRKARKAKNPNQVLCQARLPNNGLMAVELVWINCFGHRWPIGLHSRHPMAPPQIPWWFIGPCSSVEWVSQQNRYGTYSWQVKAY